MRAYTAASQRGVGDGDIGGNEGGGGEGIRSKTLLPCHAKEARAYVRKRVCFRCVVQRGAAPHYTAPPSSRSAVLRPSFTHPYTGTRTIAAGSVR